jgi:hypothetical protein
MGMHRALRLTGRAGGVDHKRRVIGCGGHRREVGGGARQRGMEIERAILPPVERQHDLHARRFDAGKLGQSVRVGDQRPGAGVLQSIGDRIHAEQGRERERDAAELVDRNVDRGDLRRLRQQNGDPVARWQAGSRFRAASRS